MLHQLEGSQAIAKAVALCRPNLICAYPITPQTHIVEALGETVRSGELQNCEYLNVESEMAAISATIGSMAAGVRSYTATSSQGLLYMMEAVYNAAGLELPIVMTIGNRAIGAPINIWNDHSDAMAVRDAGWIMLFADSNQEAVSLHIQAFKIAEIVKCPVMVCVDGFILTHAYERVNIPDQKTVDEFLPPYEPHITMDVKNPISIGAMVPPEYFMELRYMAHMKQQKAIDVIEHVADKFADKFGGNSSGLFHKYNIQDAETIIVTMGSVAGTIRDVVDEINCESGNKFGVLTLVSYRPFPQKAIREVLKNAKKVVVVEKALAVGIGGILVQEIRLSLAGTNVNVVSVIAGLGGKPITQSMLHECLFGSGHDETKFLGLNDDLVSKKSPFGQDYCANS
jgi:pyruvate ferredoxin oxidoreductase alpha subunit